MYVCHVIYAMPLRHFQVLFTKFLRDLIASSSPDEHHRHLNSVFEQFKEFGMIINPIKREFGVNQLTVFITSLHKVSGHYLIK